MKKQKIVTIGGGSGSFMVLTGLKKYPVDLSVIVSMVDDGGSSGVLRDELGVLPPGDIRQCLVALSKSDQILRELFNYRYGNGSLAGHTFGNIFLATLEKVTGSFAKAIKEAERILRVRGEIYPVTLNKKARLIALLKDGRKIVSENKIYRNTRDLVNLQRLCLKPAAELNPDIIPVIKQADKIIINPGDLYSSIIPNFLVKGMREALSNTKAKIIYVGNLMNKPGHTDGYSLVDYITLIEQYLEKDIIDYAIYNKEKPRQEMIKKYFRYGEAMVKCGDINLKPKVKFLGRNLLSREIFGANKNDAFGGVRSLVRHDSNKLAKAIYNI